jgi:hypothetical protein
VSETYSFLIDTRLTSKIKNLVLSSLNNIFQFKNDIVVSHNFLFKYEGDMVHDYFHGNSWFDLASHLDFRLDGEVLEKDCLYLTTEYLRA